MSGTRDPHVGWGEGTGRRQISNAPPPGGALNGGGMSSSRRYGSIARIDAECAPPSRREHAPARATIP